MEALAVIWAPVRTLARVAEERRVLLAFGIVALSAVLGIVNALLAVFGGLTRAQLQQPGAPPLAPEIENLFAYVEVFTIISAVASPFVYWLVVSGLMQLVTRFFGGTGPFSAMLAVTGVAQVALVISSVVSIPFTALQITLGPQDPTTGDPTALILSSLSGLLGLAFFLWYVVLVVIGASSARRVGYGQSAGSCAISCAGCIGLILILAVIFGILVAVIVGATGQGTAS